jgi:hypothetical protein
MGLLGDEGIVGLQGMPSEPGCAGLGDSRAFSSVPTPDCERRIRVKPNSGSSVSHNGGNDIHGHLDAAASLLREIRLGGPRRAGQVCLSPAALNPVA